MELGTIPKLVSIGKDFMQYTIALNGLKELA